MAVSILSQGMIRKTPAPHLMRGGYRFSGTNDFVCPKIMLQYCSASGGTMTIAEWCIFGTVILYLLTIAPVKAMGFRRFDNSKPRDPAFYDNPIAARALGAHLNGIETFPFFATAVLLAEFHAGPQRLIDELAVLFLIVQLLDDLREAFASGPARQFPYPAPESIGIGGSLTTPPLPHHRTYGSVYGGSTD